MQGKGERKNEKRVFSPAVLGGFIRGWNFSEGLEPARAARARFWALNGWVRPDSELQNAYKIPAPGQPAQNKNSAVFAPEFPALAPGGSAVSRAGGH